MARHGSPLGKILSLVFTLVVALVVIKVAPSIGHHVGDRFADDMRKQQGISSPEQVAAQREQDARAKFVPAAQSRIPAAKKVAPDRLAKFAVHTCTTLDNYYAVAHYADQIRQDARTTIPGIKPKQVERLPHLVVKTTCPTKTLGLYQFK